MCAESSRLGPETISKLRAEDSLREAREVLYVGGGGKLTTGGDVVGQETLEEDRLQLCPSSIDRRRVASGPTPDDAHLGVERGRCSGVLHGGGRGGGGGRYGRGGGGGGEG